MSNKLKAKKCHFDGITFDSGKEMKRYVVLRQMQRDGEISDLQLQVEYELIPAQREPDIVGKNGVIKKGKVIERACKYIADFVYRDREGNLVVEDTKGYKKGAHYSLFVCKRKMLLEKYGIRIKET